MKQYGSFLWVWYIDVALAFLAAVVNLLIREQHPKSS